jgi:hypothetical protein
LIPGGGHRQQKVSGQWRGTIGASASNKQQTNEEALADLISLVSYVLLKCSGQPKCVNTPAGMTTNDQQGDRQWLNHSSLLVQSQSMWWRV